VLNGGCGYTPSDADADSVRLVYSEIVAADHKLWHCIVINGSADTLTIRDYGFCVNPGGGSGVTLDKPVRTTVRLFSPQAGLRSGTPASILPEPASRPQPSSVKPDRSARPDPSVVHKPEELQ